MKLLKKFFIAISLIITGNIYAIDLVTAPEIDSESYILLDFETNKVLLSEKENDIKSPASLTKVMTAYVVFKEIQRGVIKDTDNLKVSKRAVLTARNHDSSRMFLDIGDVVPINEVLKGLIVQSGNDAAIALAEHISGTESNFALLMNAYAKELGMNNSKFQNASGLPAKEHYTTASDLSKLMYALIKEFPMEYKKYFSLKSYTYGGITQDSRNKLLFKDESFEGGKTGWHQQAKYCYIASVNKNNRRLILVTLKAKRPQYRFQDAVALANFGYRFYENHHLVKANSPIDGMTSLPLFKSDKSNITITPKDSIVLTLKRGQFEKINALIDIKDKIVAPVSKGDKIGEIKIFLEDKEIAKSDIVLNEDAKRGDWMDVLVDDIALKFSN